MQFVKVLEEVFPQDVRKALVKVTSRFTEPVQVSVGVDEPEGFFERVEPETFTLGPGESRIVELYLNPRAAFKGVEKTVRLVFKSVTYITSEYREATLVMRFKRVRSAFDVDVVTAMGGSVFYHGLDKAMNLNAGVTVGFELDKALNLDAGATVGFELDKALTLGGGLVGSVS